MPFGAARHEPDDVILSRCYVALSHALRRSSLASASGVSRNHQVVATARHRWIEVQAARFIVDFPLTRLTDEAATTTANAIRPANRMKKSGPSASLAAAKLAPTM
jgi:hypothetical protein